MTLVPANEAELVEAIRTADGPLAIRGGGTRPTGRPVDGTALCTDRIAGITLYEPGALTLVARAGTPLTEIDAALATENQMLAFEPMDHRPILGTAGEPTIGGVVAANISGPRRVSAGACRDFLLGVRFVDGQGNVIKNGGRVMKNVTGYDLVKLMAGSYGTLGVLTEVALKVLPRPEAEATLTFRDLPPERAVAAMAAALGTPFEVTGATYGPADWDAPGPVRLRLEGMASSVAYRARRLAGALSSFGEAEVEDDPEESRKIWSDLRDVKALADHPFVARSAMKPTGSVEFTRTIGQTLRGTDFYDWGGGRVWTGASADDLRANAADAADPARRDDPDEGGAILLGAMQEYMRLAGGHTTLVKAGAALRREVAPFQALSAPVARLTEGLRRKFDPRGILNPGLMG